MSATSNSLPSTPPLGGRPPSPSSRWILNSWGDLALFVATPLVIVPLVMVLLRSAWFGLSVETLSVLVAAFGALGHHLPGMLRAYGDRELFRRFRLRFILAPLFLLAVCIPLSQHHLSSMLLILLLWGFWHGLMQVYGFVRIYDAKVGSNARWTAPLDWLMCLMWFGAGLISSDGMVVRIVSAWYSAGGPLIPPAAIDWSRTLWWGGALVVLVAFAFNFVRQWRIGPRPNPNKLLMLAGGIGFWWFAMVYVDNILLGVALFEIFHDVQYLAIVWLFNRRRAETNPAVGSFMRFLFRRSPAMLLAYMGMVLAYGWISYFGKELESETWKRALMGFVWASTLLHFYYDGFIWKVREKSIRAGLGLTEGASTSTKVRMDWGELTHLVKWAPFVGLVTWLTLAESEASTPPPPGQAQRVWPGEAHFQWYENIVRIVPSDLVSQSRYASMLDNVGRTDEAQRRLTDLLEKHPGYVQGHLLLGEIHQRLQELDEAGACYEAGLAAAKLPEDRFAAHVRLGALLRQQEELDRACEQYEQALKLRPQDAPAAAALREVQLQRNARQPRTGNR
ncbi:MAG: tetratricopeptide repeat protein [Planctomycetales bacterium]